MKKITETNWDKKEGICEHYIPHYIKREGGFRYCEAGHCSLHERNGILIDGDKNICKLFEMENVDKWQEAKEKFCKRCRNDLLKNTEELLNILAAYKNERK